jgi:hypothetical protein
MSAITAARACCGILSSWLTSKWSSAAEIVRYRRRGIDLYFRADAAFAKPEIYELLEAKGIRYAIRLPANQVVRTHWACAW